MSEKYKHSERLEETLRYLNNALTNEERYSFEREIERDPFLEEAFEGLSSLKSSEIDRDIRSLDVIAGKKRKSFYAIRYLGYAAGIAVIIFLGFWGLQNIDFSKRQTAKSADDAESAELREPYKPAVIASTDSIVKDSANILVADAALNQSKTGTLTDKGTLTKDQTTLKDINKKKIPLKGTLDQSHTLQAQKAEEKTEADSDKASTETIAPAIAAEAPQKSAEEIAAVENTLRRPGVNADPQPLGGTTLFKEYLERNAKYPGGIQNAKKEFVKVKFKISKTGQPFGIIVEKSPDQQFSQEAIRLILEGPKWSPEIKDGIPVEGEVSVKINFKP